MADAANVQATASRQEMKWIVPNITSRTQSRIESGTFRVGGYAWRLVYMHDSAEPSRNASAFLTWMEAQVVAPDSPYCPIAAFKLSIANHIDATREWTLTGSDHAFSSRAVESGFRIFILREVLTADSGWLTADGSLVLRLELEVKNPKDSCALYSDPDPTSYADYLSLMGNPGQTSDLAIVAGCTGSSGPGGSGGSGGGGSGSSSDGGGGGGGGGGCNRTFHVHRAVLSARCPYFRTLFNAGMADSAARELHLPAADPDTFAALLPYMYGGKVPPCERAVHRAAIALCDMLLLHAVKEALEVRLVESADEVTIAADLLWAAESGQEGLLTQLVAAYKQVPWEMDLKAAHTLVVANPRLAVRLLVAGGAAAAGAATNTII